MSRVIPLSHEASVRVAQIWQKGPNQIRSSQGVARSKIALSPANAVAEQSSSIANTNVSGIRVAIFVDGGFWHGCPERTSWPQSNAQFWQEKIKANRVREGDANQRFYALSWRVIRFWAYEHTQDGAGRIGTVVRGGSRIQ